MSAITAPDNARHEIKFATSVTRMPRIEEWVGSHRAGFFEPYPARQVNNVYFDGFDLSAYRENLSGTSRRSKVRFRWYGELEQAESGTLEVKRRESGLGWKLSFRTEFVPLENRRWTVVRRQLRQALARQGRLWLDANPVPVLINRYRRRYFESADRRVRVTFDWHQRVYDQRLLPVPNFSRRANLPESMVVEFKFHPDDRRQASDWIQGIPLRVSRNSKYVIGVQAILRG
jgi:hypothetical protein